jgi:hypothetical protein
LGWSPGFSRSARSPHRNQQTGSSRDSSGERFGLCWNPGFSRSGPPKGGTPTPRSNVDKALARYGRGIKHGWQRTGDQASGAVDRELFTRQTVRTRPWSGHLLVLGRPGSRTPLPLLAATASLPAFIRSVFNPWLSFPVPVCHSIASIQPQNNELLTRSRRHVVRRRRRWVGGSTKASGSRRELSR